MSCFITVSCKNTFQFSSSMHANHVWYLIICICIRMYHSFSAWRTACCDHDHCMLDVITARLLVIIEVCMLGAFQRCHHQPLNTLIYLAIQKCNWMFYASAECVWPSLRHLDVTEGFPAERNHCDSFIPAFNILQNFSGFSFCCCFCSKWFEWNNIERCLQQKHRKSK